MSAHQIDLQDFALMKFGFQNMIESIADASPSETRKLHSQARFKLSKDKNSKEGEKQSISLCIGKDDLVQSSKYSKISERKAFFI